MGNVQTSKRPNVQTAGVGFRLSAFGFRLSADSPPTADGRQPIADSRFRRLDVLHRGSVSVATLLIMVLLGLSVVLMVLGGAADHDLALRRIESVRALYAAEAGANMALRELVLGVDEDGDGGVGTISDDGNPANDPALPGAIVHVTRDFDQDIGQSTLVSRGRSGMATRIAQVRAIHDGEGDPVAMIAYGIDGTTRPAFRLWNEDAGTWAAQMLARDVGSDPQWIVLRGDPQRERFALGVLGSDGLLTVQMWSRETNEWTTPFVVSTAVDVSDARPFDLAFGGISGTLVLIYQSQSGPPRVSVRTWSDDVWSNPVTVNLVPQDAQWLRLVPKRGSNELLLLGSSAHAQGHTRATTWNGSLFENQVQLGLSQTRYAHMDAGYERYSGDAVTVYGRGTSVPGYRSLTDGAWSAEMLLPTVSGNLNWSRMATSPVQDELIAVLQDANAAVSVNVWDGASWSGMLELDFAAEDVAIESFDVAYGRKSGQALVAYSHAGNALRCRFWNGSAWTAEFDGPAGGAGPLRTVQAVSGVNDDSVFVTWVTDDPLIRTTVWNGVSFSSPLDLSTPGAAAARKPYMAAIANEFGRPRVVAWNEVEP